MSIRMKSPARMLGQRGLGPGGPVQMDVALGVIRRMQRYTPQESGALAGSARAARGGREVRQRMPYARIQYESTRLRHKGMGTHHWFEVMKRNGGAGAILQKARRRAGAR